MSAPGPFLSPAEAVRRLGVSAKALRIYEERGLIAPGRTPSGWRAYGPDEMRRAGEIAALRRLGFSLEQVRRVLEGEMPGRGAVADCLAPPHVRSRTTGMIASLASGVAQQ